MEPGIKEIQNLKNTCYINSVVHLLAYVYPVRRVFCEQLQFAAIPTKLELVKEFYVVLNQIWDDSKERIVPKSFVNKCFSLSTFFVPHTQQDSQEFLMIFLDKLESELEGLTPNSSSLINDTFQGNYENQLRCLDCGFESSKLESFIQLALPIPEGLEPMNALDCSMSPAETRMIADIQQSIFNVFSMLSKPKAALNLYYCLVSFFQEQLGEMYCSQCMSHTSHHIKLSLTDSPKYFLMSLKRFRYNFWSSKNTDRVFLPKKLNLKIFSQIDCSYSLAAVVEHSGFLFRGHYKIYVKKGKQWWILNDKHVEKCNWETVFRAQPYIMMYVRKDQLDADPINNYSKGNHAREEKKH